MPLDIPLHIATPMNTPPDLRAMAEDVFGAIAKARFVSVGSVMAYAGPDGLTLELLDTWRRAGLLHRGAVQPDPLQPDSVEYVALTTLGARTLAAAMGAAVRGMTPARLKRSSQKRAHDLGIGEFTLAVLALAKAYRIDLVGVETDDKRLATVVHLADIGKPAERIVLQADTLVVTRGRLGSEAVLVEIDRGTTAPQRMQTRYRGYLAWQRTDGPSRHFGIKALRVLTLVPDQARLDRLHAAALEANGGRRSGFLAFGLLDDFTVCTAERLLEPSVRSLGDDFTDRIHVLSSAPQPRAA